MAKEKDFENRIKKYIDSVGGWQVKFFANAYTKTGIPDVLACVNGHFIGVEVKAENGRISALQTMQIKRIRAAGGIGVVVYPSGWEAFKRLIDDLKQDQFDLEKIPSVMK